LETSAPGRVLGETDNGRLAVSVVDAPGDPTHYATLGYSQIGVIPII